MMVGMTRRVALDGATAANGDGGVGDGDDGGDGGESNDNGNGTCDAFRQRPIIRRLRLWQRR